MHHEFITCNDVQGNAIWDSTTVFQGDPIYVRVLPFGGKICGKIVGISEPLNAVNRAAGKKNVLVQFKPGEPGIGHQVVVFNTEVERLFCDCEWEDDGDGESGPHLALVEVDKDCPIHGAEGCEF